MLKAEIGGQFQTCRALDTLCLHCCDLLLGVVLESGLLLKFKQNQAIASSQGYREDL